MIQINKLVRSKRKTLSLIIETDGTLTARAPLRMKEADIRRFIEEKKNWIKRKQAQALEDAVQPRQFVDGEKFLYLGKEVTLRIVPAEGSRWEDGKPALVMGRVFKLTKAVQPQAKSVFEAWYKKQARKVLTERVGYFAQKHGFKVGKIRISSARTRWGSYSSKGTLSFTWRLVMAPQEIVDYVVVHELCHLREMNHSKAFWALVEDILPDYKERRKWLKNHGKFLVV
jgi:predicted metal-dependent hydrolase